MKTILVPTDYSEAADNALHYAVELALLSKAKIVLLHAYHVPLPTGDVPVLLVSPAELEKENVMRIKELKKQLEKKFSEKVKLDHVVRAGFVPDEVLTVAKEKNADLVVMGIKGETRLSRALLGSNTASVMRSAQTPVLAIPSGCRFKKPSKIVLAYDFSKPVPKKVLDTLKMYTSLFNAKLLVLDVVKPEAVPVYDDAVAGLKLENSLKSIPHSLYFPEGEDVVSEINSFADSYKADWLVMMPHKHKFFSGLFHKSNTKQMAFHTHLPLLSLHD